MKLIFTVSIFMTLLNFTAGSAARGDAKELYQEGIRLYQNSNWQEANGKLLEALMQDPNNPYILYNLGLSEYRLERIGASIAYWRKALTIRPGLGPAEVALKKALNESVKTQTHTETSFWERFRSQFLVKFQIRYVYLFSALALLAAGWAWISYLGHRKRALDDETPLPPPPYMPIIMSLLFVTSCLLLGSKLIDQSTLRGTIIAEKVMARSGPGTDSSDLFELFEATEVILRNTKEDWYQVSYPGGLTGWIPKSEIFQTSGDPL